MQLSGLYHSRCEDIFPLIDDGTLDCIITDMPFNVSETAKTEHEIGGFHDRMAFQRYYGAWDMGFNPLYLIGQAARVLRPGGWLITFNGDRLFGAFRDFVSGDQSTTAYYLQYYRDLLFLNRGGYVAAMTKLESAKKHLTRLFEYKATTAWHITNPPTRVRKTTALSSMIWIQIARRLDDVGETTAPVAWNFLGQRDMHNFFEGPICGAPERLYWHVLDPECGEDKETPISGKIVPCRRRGCALCKKGFERRRHPTQKPTYAWDWIFRRYTKPGLKVFDPYCGVGSSLIAARKFGLDIFGSEMLWEYATVGKLWINGAWQVPIGEDIKQAVLQ